MLRAAMAQAGVTPQTGATFAQMLHALGCQIEGMAASMALEYGRPGPELRPHNPADVPHFDYHALTAGVTVTADVEGALGKFVTRGHVANIGDGEIILAFQGVSGDNWSAEYHLPSGAVLDTSSFAYRKVRMTAVDMDGRAQIMAQ